MPAGLDGNPDPLVTVERTVLLDRLVEEIRHRQGASTALVAVDGASGTGKSTLADELAGRLDDDGDDVVRASIDSFHRPRAQRYRLGTSSPVGYYRDSHDLDAVRRQLLDPFQQGEGSVLTAVFDEPSDQPVALSPVAVRPGSTLIMDGLFLHREELVGFWTFSVFLVADVRREADWRRWLHHDLPTDAGEQGREIDDRLRRSRRARYVDGQALYELDSRPRLRADAVVDNNDVGRPVLLRLRRR